MCEYVNEDSQTTEQLRHKIRNTFGIDVTCRRYVEVSDVREAVDAIAGLDDADMPLLIVGGGSNILFTRDFEGTVLHSAIRGMTHRDDGDGVLLRCGSGETWDDVVDLCVRHGWHGVENLSGIPGDVGATAVQNIGAYGVEVGELIRSIEAVETGTGRLCVIDAADCCYAYRYSRFKDEWRGRFLITHVTYRLHKLFNPRLDYGNIADELRRKGISQPTAEQMRQTVTEIRNAKLPDPRKTGNAGSFFMNPVVSREKYEAMKALYPDMPHYAVADDKVKIPAGWLIDRCGWKGRSIGRAAVHDRQALVLVNKGGASGREIVHLCRMIQANVERRFGITLTPEVLIV